MAHAEGKVLVGIGGGLDSAVTAALLRSQGHEVEALFLRLGEPDGQTGFQSRCARVGNEERARAICKKLDLTLHVEDVREEFEAEVVDAFVHDRLQQRRALPCFACNRQLRFKHLFLAADRLGFEYVATGHRARVQQDAAARTSRLFRCQEKERDQSAHLAFMGQKELSRCLLPLGGIPESMIARLATEFQLRDLCEEQPPSDRKECFVDDPAAPEFVISRTALSLRPVGVIRTIEGQIVGEHRGFHRYSIGEPIQEPLTLMDPSPYFVFGFDLARQVLIVGREDQLLRQKALANRAHWVRAIDGLHGMKCDIVLGVDAEPIGARVTLFESDVVELDLNQPTGALTPGQACVFYQGDEVLGGAVIDRLGSAE